MPELLAIDLDDVLFNENDAIRTFHNEQYGTVHTAEDYRIDGEFNQYWERLWGADIEELGRRYEAYLEHKVTRHLEPMPDAAPVLEELKGKFDGYIAITSRGAKEVDSTYAALNLYYPGLFSDVFFVPLWNTNRKVMKVEICKAVGANSIVEDSFEQCEAASEAGVQHILVFGDMGWNRWQPLQTGMTRVRDWRAVKGYFA